MEERDDSLVFTSAMAVSDQGEPVVISTSADPLAIRIRDELISRPSLSGIDIAIRVSDGQALISGAVASPSQRDDIIETTARLAGPERVIDCIEIEQDTPDILDE